MNAHDTVIRRRAQRETERSNTLLNLAADLRSARSHRDRLLILDRHSATLQALEPKFNVPASTAQPRLAYVYTWRHPDGR